MLRKIVTKLRDYYLINLKWKRFNLGKNFHAGKNVVLWAKNNITIGKNCYIGRNSQIECDVEFGDNIIIANNVAFVGKYDHHYQQVGSSIRMASQIRDIDYDWLGLNSRTILEDDVWIGYGSIIMSGVTIKKGSIVAAGSVVTKDIEEYSIYGGNPAKKIADRFDSPEDLKIHKNSIQGL